MGEKLTTKLLDALILLLGIFSAALGLQGFLLPNHFLDGGVTGLSLLLAEVSGFHLSIF